MIENLSPLTRKFAAVGLLLIAILTVLNLVVLPLADRHARQAEAIADTRRQIAAFRQVLARGPALKARIEEVEREPRHRRGFLLADSPALAGARLENKLKSIVQSSGGTMRSTRMQPQTGDGPERVRVNLDFTAQPRAVLTIAHKIETTVPYLTTDNVHIRLSPVRDDRPVKIMVRMDVSAFVWRTEQ